MTANPIPGLTLDFDPDEAADIHEFCGPHEIEGASCPNCSKMLLRLLSLSATDKRLNVDSAITPFVHLLYCWTCSIPFGVFSYRLHPDGSVNLLSVPPVHEWQFGPDGPYDGYTGAYPKRRVGLVPLSDQIQSRQQEALTDEDVFIDLLSEQAHQVGGQPVIANPEEVLCPVCSGDSPLFAAICDDASGNDPNGVAEEHSFTANSSIQMVFHFCRSCSVVSAYHSVS